MRERASRAAGPAGYRTRWNDASIVSLAEITFGAATLAMLCSYVLGTLPGASIVAGRHGVNLRETGDGNPGAWNALEQLGWSRAWPAFLLDGLKGAAAALLGWLVAGAAPWDGPGGLLRGTLLSDPAAGHWLPWACVGAAMIGHALPLVRPGGKSVMTFAGGALVLIPAGGALLLGLFVVLAARGRAALGARLAVFGVPVVQVSCTPLVQVGWTGLLMSLIGLLFLVRRPPRASARGS